MTDAEFIAWLKRSDSIRCVLVEVEPSIEGTPTTLYLSNTGFVTGPDETPANTPYRHQIVAGCQVSERLSLDGAASMAVSDIEVQNLNGERDDWLTAEYVWRSAPVQMYVGDQRWPREDFRLVFDGVVDDIDSRDRNVLNLKIRDKLQRLNTPVTETKLGGSSTNADKLLPLVFGEVHNVEPLLTNKATLEYQVHNGPIERVIEVRDYGVVVSTTNTLSTGKFTLSANPKGTITCSIQGDKPTTYSNTVSKLVQRLAMGFGTDAFVSGDLDAVQLAAFDSAHPQPVGLHLDSRANVLQVCQELAASVGAQVVMSATGLLRLLKVQAATAGTAVTGVNMRENSLRLAGRVPVVASVKLGYAKNWTVQKDLQTGLPAEHKGLYGEEWLTVTSTDSAVATAYKLTQEPVQEDSLLLVQADATAEAARRLELWKTPRSIFAYEGFPELLLEEIGGMQTITHSRFGMSGGLNGQIVATTKDWLGKGGGVAVEVLV